MWKLPSFSQIYNTSDYGVWKFPFGELFYLHNFAANLSMIVDTNVVFLNAFEAHFTVPTIRYQKKLYILFASKIE